MDPRGSPVHRVNGWRNLITGAVPSPSRSAPMRAAHSRRADGPRHRRVRDDRVAQGRAVLFTDIVLGRGLNGFELAQQGVLVRPQLKVLYATGYARGLEQWHTMVPGSYLLRKPYRALDLLTEVSRLLRRDETAARRRHRVSRAFLRQYRPPKADLPFSWSRMILDPTRSRLISSRAWG